jgi:hypothetical protein
MPYAPVRNAEFAYAAGICGTPKLLKLFLIQTAMIKYNRAGLYFSAVKKEVLLWGRRMINRAGVGMIVATRTISARLRSAVIWNW